MSTFLAKLENSTEVIDFIMSREWTPKELREQFAIAFPDVQLNFGMASEIDAIAFSQSYVPSPFWAAAYGFPQDGTIIHKHNAVYSVVWCGAFTCSLDFISYTHDIVHDEDSDEEYPIEEYPDDYPEDYSDDDGTD